jgi:hypothetical protein
MSNITTAEFESLKEKASRRLSFRVSPSKDDVSTNASSQGTSTPQLDSTSVQSNSTVEIAEGKVNSYRGAADAFKEIMASKLNQVTPKEVVSNLKVAFPTCYNFDSNKFIFRNSQKEEPNKEIDTSISGIRKTIKKMKIQNKLKKKSSKTSKKKKTDQTPSILDKVYSFPSYSRVIDQFAEAQKLFKKSRNLNKSSGSNVSKLSNNHNQFQKLRSQFEIDSLTQGENSVENNQLNF